MLVGPSRPAYPPLPTEAEGLRGILNYLRGLQRFNNDNLSTVVATTIGLLGVRGLSATGTPANNFTRGFLDIGDQTSSVWSLVMESNATYLVLYSASVSTGVVITDISKGTTSVTFTFNPAVPSGVRLDLVLLR